MPFWREGGSVLPPPPPPTRKPPLPPSQPKTGINVTPKTPPPMPVQPPPLPEPLPSAPMAVPPPPPPTAVTTRRQVMPPAHATYSPSAQLSGAMLQYEPSAKVQAPQYAAPRIPRIQTTPSVGQGPGNEEEEGRVRRRIVRVEPWRFWQASPLAGLNRMGFSSLEDMYSFLVGKLGYSEEYAREVVNRLNMPLSYATAISSPGAPETFESPEAAIYHLLELQRAANYNPDLLQSLRNSETAAQLAAFYSGNLAVGWPDYYMAEQGELPYIDIGGYPFDYSTLVAFAPAIQSLFGLSTGEEQPPGTEEGESGGAGGTGGGRGYGGGAPSGQGDIAVPSDDVQPPSTEEPAPRVPRNYEIASWLSRLIKVMPGRVFQFPEPARRVLRNMGLADELWKILLDLGFKPVDIGPDGFPTDVIVPEKYDYDPGALTQYLNGLSRLQRFVLRYLLAVNFNIGEIPEPPKKLKPPKPTR